MSDAAARVVIVEDDTSLRRAMQRLLQACGLSTSAFESAEDFLTDQESQLTCNCFVLDLHLGGMSGMELMDICGISGANTIFITAYDEETARQAARTRMAAAFLVKPFEGATLVEAVSQVIGRPLASCVGVEVK